MELESVGDRDDNAPGAIEGDTMRIGIIGAGNIGANLTRRLTHLGLDVAVANSRGPGTLAALVQETGARALSVVEVAQGANLVIITIPEKSISVLPAGFLDRADPEVIVVDTGNYYPQQRDGRIDAIEAGMTESRWVSEQIGHEVVKAFNAIYAVNLVARARDHDAPDRMAMPIAGDEPAAKDAVMNLVLSMGFDPVDAGTIDNSWRQQPGTPVYGLDADANGVRLALAAAHHVRTEEWRAQK